MSEQAEHELSHLLRAWTAGKPGALDRLTPLVYDELQRQARRLFQRERPDHTLQPTALVHEVFLRLAGEERVSWQSRAHFFGAAARLMRRVLVDHARERGASKRGGALRRLELPGNLAGAADRTVDLLALDRALGRLAQLDRRQVTIVELRYFAGLTVDETAEVLGIGRATVVREWRSAKAWLARELGAPRGRAG